MDRVLSRARVVPTVAAMLEHDEACLYTVIEAPRERHDALLRELVAPFVSRLRDDPALDSLFVVRYADPVWQLRVRVLGRPAWIQGEVRPRLERALEPFLAGGAIEGVAFGEYLREWERYGGPLGMRLAERIFTHDSLACLELLEAEAQGVCGRSRREWSLAFVEDLLDAFELDDAGRAAFYRFAHAWAYREGIFEHADRDTLDARYRSLRPGLEALRAARRAGDWARVYGGDVAAAIARRCQEATRPVLEQVRRGCADGSVAGDPVALAWSYTHMHCNRLGIDVPAEAILRYLMVRFYDDEARAVAGGA